MCWTPFQRLGRQRFCSSNCRKTAWARTHKQDKPAGNSDRGTDTVIYACTACQTQYYCQQFCYKCNQPAKAIGYGDLYPRPDEPAIPTTNITRETENR